MGESGGISSDEYQRVLLRPQFFFLIWGLLTAMFIGAVFARNAPVRQSALAACALAALIEVPARAELLEKAREARNNDIISMAARWRTLGIEPYSQEVLILAPSDTSLMTQQKNACPFAYPVHMQRVGRSAALYDSVRGDDWFRKIYSCYAEDASRYTVWHTSWFDQNAIDRLKLSDKVTGKVIYARGKIVVVDRTLSGDEQGP